MTSQGLTEASDSGRSNTDNVTNLSPVLEGTVENSQGRMDVEITLLAKDGSVLDLPVGVGPTFTAEVIDGKWSVALTGLDIDDGSNDGVYSYQVTATDGLTPTTITETTTGETLTFTLDNKVVLESGADIPAPTLTSTHATAVDGTTVTGDQSLILVVQVKPGGRRSASKFITPPVEKCSPPQALPCLVKRLAPRGVSMMPIMISFLRVVITNTISP